MPNNNEGNHHPFQEWLRLIACSKNATGGEPVVTVLAAQPTFSLSRAEVEKLSQMLASADAALDALCPPPPSLLASTQAVGAATGTPKEENDDEGEGCYALASATLHTKIRFDELPLRQPAHSTQLYQEPVATLQLITPVCELTKHELQMLMMEVTGLLYSIKEQEAIWFYAFESFTGVYHLMAKEHADRRAPALCGSRPMLPVSGATEENVTPRWYLRPLDKEEKLEEQRVCPACLTLWKAQT